MNINLVNATSLFTVYGPNPNHDPDDISTWGRGPLLVQIATDGTLTYGEGYDPDEAAKRFWQALADQGLVTVCPDPSAH